jgi:hypothetical protein
MPSLRSPPQLTHCRPEGFPEVRPSVPYRELGALIERLPELNLALIGQTQGVLTPPGRLQVLCELHVMLLYVALLYVALVLR